MDDNWKKDVLKRMDERLVSKADLARELNVAPSAVTQLLSFAEGSPRQSRLVPRIHKILGLVNTTKPADAIERDDAYRRLMASWADLSNEQREEIARLSELLSKR